MTTTVGFFQLGNDKTASSKLPVQTKPAPVQVKTAPVKPAGSRTGPARAQPKSVEVPVEEAPVEQVTQDAPKEPMAAKAPRPSADVGGFSLDLGAEDVSDDEFKAYQG